MASEAQGYDRELSSLQVREAVFLGRGGGARLVEFLKDYVQTFPASGNTIYLARAEVATPYKQIVERARRDLGGSYSPLQAQTDYERSPRRVLLELTFLRPLLALPQPDRTPAAALGPSPLDLLEGFTYSLTQRSHEVRVQIQLIDGIYNCGEFGCLLVGTRVVLAAEAAEVESALLALEVEGPASGLTRVTFDLARFR